MANLLGTRLTDSDYGSRHSVFVYSFATPNTTKLKDQKYYQNVISWNNKNDLICSLPAGLTKHGVACEFSLQFDPAMNEYFQRLTGGKDLAGYGPIGNVKSSHAPETYLSFLLTINRDVSIR